MNWDHVTAEVTQRILKQDSLPTVIEIMQAYREMAAAFAEDQQDITIGDKPISIRSKAVASFKELLVEDFSAYDEQGEYTGNAGHDKIAIMECIKYYWSDGAEGKLPDPMMHIKNRVPRIHAIFTGTMAITDDVLRLALDLTWMQHELSERVDLSDFDPNDWSKMRDALLAADNFVSHEDVIENLKTYWLLWRQYSTIY